MTSWLHALDSYGGYGPRPVTIASRFYKYVEPGATDVCWNWKGAKSEAGYGRLNVKGSPLYAHRIAWELKHGEFQQSLQVLHSCDNPACVNPAHLFLGTQSVNMQDCKLKERNLFAVSLADAELIRQTYAARSPTESKMALQEALGLRYGVSSRTIRYIVTGERR